jgi:hypothetical protein
MYNIELQPNLWSNLYMERDIYGLVCKVCFVMGQYGLKYKWPVNVV